MCVYKIDSIRTFNGNSNNKIVATRAIKLHTNFLICMCIKNVSLFMSRLKSAHLLFLSYSFARTLARWTFRRLVLSVALLLHFTVGMDFLVFYFDSTKSISYQRMYGSPVFISNSDFLYAALFCTVLCCFCCCCCFALYLCFLLFVFRYASSIYI